jgi:hypothetical protein
LSFEDAPPAIFWTRSWPSSVFSSSSCFFKSSLPLVQSVPGLTLALVDYTQALVLLRCVKLQNSDWRTILAGIETLSTSNLVWWLRRGVVSASSMSLDDETNFRNVWNECQELLFST